tara:strand:- start:4420 stop:6348 length:1929 start_codon:yes stop_codon:yes gene_type:complete
MSGQNSTNTGRSGTFNTAPFGQEATLAPVGTSDQLQGNPGFQQILSNKPSSRYDQFRGLFGDSNDARASLLLNTIEDMQFSRVYQDAGAVDPVRYNFNPDYFRPGTPVVQLSGLNYPTEVVDYLREILGNISNGLIPTGAAASVQAVANSVQSSIISTMTSSTLQAVVDALYVQTPNLQYSPNAFANLMALINIDPNDIIALRALQYQSNPNGFPNFLPDKVALQKFLEATEAANRAAVQGPTVSSTPAAVTPENVFFRKVGQPNQIFTVNQSGEEVEVQAGSAIYSQLTESNQCYGTGTSGNADECNKYFTRCLAGQDIQGCQEFMNSGTFWANAESAVKSMLPDVLLATLTSFGFKPYDSKTSTGRPYRAYPSAEEWLSGLSASLGGDQNAIDTVDKVGKNSRLMGYLNMIVAKVNANPGIANPTYVEDGPAYNPNAFAGTLGAKYGIKGKAFAPKRNFAKPAPTPTTVSALENTVVNFMGPLGMTYGIAPMSVGLGMMGGGEELDVTNELKLPLQVAPQLNEMYENILENLQVGGKDLDAGDQQTIKKMVNELNVLENKLFKSASYVQGYNDLLAVQNGGSLVNESNLEKFVAKRNDYFNRVNSKYQTIFPIFSKLAEACERETIDAADNVTAEYYPKA